MSKLWPLFLGLANVDSAAINAVYYDVPVCEDDAVGMAHTHLAGSRQLSNQDVELLWQLTDHMISIVVWGAGEQNGIKLLGTNIRLRHGVEFEWVVPIIKWGQNENSDSLPSSFGVRRR